MPRQGLARFSMPHMDTSLRQAIVWDEAVEQVTWQRDASNRAPEVIGQPRLPVSSVCCNPDDFSLLGDDGLMQRAGNDWTL